MRATTSLVHHSNDSWQQIERLTNGQGLLHKMWNICLFNFIIQESGQTVQSHKIAFPSADWLFTINISSCHSLVFLKGPVYFTYGSPFDYDDDNDVIHTYCKKLSVLDLFLHVAQLSQQWLWIQ